MSSERLCEVVYMNRLGYKITNKRRFYTFLIILLTIPLIIIAIFSNQKRVYSSTYDSLYKEVLVKEGDTLWKIAIENMPSNYDVRKMVYEIKEFNQIIDSNIYPGDVIKVPIKYAPDK